MKGLRDNIVSFPVSKWRIGNVLGKNKYPF